MARLPRPLRRMISLFRRSSRDTEMQQEMAFHVESITQELIRGGMNEVDARRAARARFGDIVRHKEQGHDVRIGHRLDDLARDIRHSARGLRKSPGFTLAVVATLAIGIGGNVAIFSLVDQLLLRPLPYPQGDKLVIVTESFRGGPGASLSAGRGRLVDSVSPANWLDWQRDSRTIAAMAAFRTTQQTLTGAGDPERLRVQQVSHEFFPLLGVAPYAGRVISPQDDRPKAPRVAVLAHRLWQDRFGADPTIVGRIIQLDETPVEVVGVMPPGFQFLQPDVDLWSAYQLNRTAAWREIAGRFMNVVGRISPDASLGQASAEMDGIGGRLSSAFSFNKNTTVLVVPLREELTGQVQASLVALYAAVGVLLSIVCFNAASLLLARGASRRHEIAIRTALGAGRFAIVRQLLVESLLLAGAGGVLGIALARGSLTALLALAPPNLLRVTELSLDLRVLTYALGLSLVTGLVVGLAPAALVAGGSLITSIRSGGVKVTHAPRVRQLLVVAQVALTVILLCGAGLLVRTVVALDHIDPGFDRRNLLTMEVTLPAARYTNDRKTQFTRQTVDALGALPGVEMAAAANSLAIVGRAEGGTIFHRVGTPKLPINESPATSVRIVTPGFFRTLGIPVLRGREFTTVDDANPAPGFVVNDAFVKTHLSGIDPLTVTMSVWMRAENPYAPIIGVVANVNDGSLKNDAGPTVFYSDRQLPLSGVTFFVRTTRPMATGAAAVNTIRKLDANLAVTRVRTFEGALAESLARERLNALVSGAFAVVGLLLSCLGLYGLLAFLVAERTREIGIRIALGADSRRLTGSVVANGLRLVAMGAVVGVAGALFVLRSLQTLLFGVTTGDVSTYGAVLVLLATVAALASYVPARAAARIEPLRALRQE